MDVITNEYTTKEVSSGNTAFPFDTKFDFGDVHLFSFSNNKIANIKIIYRNITEKQTSGFFSNDIRSYSLPAVFSKNNDLYFLYFLYLGNTANADDTNPDSKLKKKQQANVYLWWQKWMKNLN